MVGLILGALWLYLPPYTDSFVGDDFVQLWRIREFLDSPFKSFLVFSPNWTDWYYRPLQNLWFLGNRLLFGLIPVGYYLLQILWHLLSTSLVYAIARQLRVGAVGALAAAALFAVSGQHQLTVSWISSIGIVMSLTFSLVAIALYLAYLKRPNQTYRLVLVVIFTLAALLAHEEGLLLPIFLFALWWSNPVRRPLGRVDLFVWFLLLLLMSGYVWLQFTRPNANIALSDSVGSWLAAVVSPSNASRMTIQIGTRWLLFSNAAWGTSLSGRLSQAPVLEIGVAMAVVAILVVWFRAGGRVVRLGLFWTALHLGFIYVVLWSQRPELLDGRHTYGAWFGVCLALGASTQSVYHYLGKETGHRRSHRSVWALMVVVFIALVTVQSISVRNSHNGVLNLTRRVQQLEVQMKEMLPAVTTNTKVFANRFLLTAPYFSPTAAVWYERPDLSGGDLGVLKEYPTVTDDYYLFDYDEGGIYNLMPELQQHKETVLIWRKPPDKAQRIDEQGVVELEATDYELDIVAGPADNRRLAISVVPTANSWASLSYNITVPRDGRLAFAYLGQPGQIFRVRVELLGGQTMTVFESSVDADESNAWKEVVLPMTEFAGSPIQVSFELYSDETGVHEPGLWSNPRLVID